MGSRGAALWTAIVLSLAGAGRAQPAAPATTPAATPAPTPAVPAAPAAPAAPPAQASAAPSSGGAPAAARAEPPPLSAAEQALASTDPELVASGLAALGEIGGAAVVAPISERLREGLPPALAQRAIDVLAATGKPAATPVLLELLVHRRPAIRAAATKALGTLGARSSSGRLVGLLEDPEPEVRAAAIEALGRCGDRRAREPLFAAMDRGEQGAALALARLAAPGDVAALVAYAKDRPFATIEPALRELLARESFPLQGKLRVVASVGELGTRSAQDFLRAWLEELPETGKAPMMRAVERAMQTARRIETERSGPAQASSAPAAPAPAPSAPAPAPATSGKATASP